MDKNLQIELAEIKGEIMQYHTVHGHWPTDSAYRSAFARYTGRFKQKFGMTFKEIVNLTEGDLLSIGKASAEPDYTISDEDAAMAGLVKPIPRKYRMFFAELIGAVECALNRKHNICLESVESEKEAAVLLVSDTHAGKMFWDDRRRVLYNKDICAFRLALLKERVIKLLTKHLRKNTMDEFVLCLLGDLVDGSGIYPSQETHQDLHAFTDQTALVAAGIWDLILAIRELGVRVRVRAVPGNHGRQGKMNPPA